MYKPDSLKVDLIFALR